MYVPTYVKECKMYVHIATYANLYCLLHFVRMLRGSSQRLADELGAFFCTVLYSDSECDIENKLFNAVEAAEVWYNFTPVDDFGFELEYIGDMQVKKLLNIASVSFPSILFQFF